MFEITIQTPDENAIKRLLAYAKSIGISSLQINQTKKQAAAGTYADSVNGEAESEKNLTLEDAPIEWAKEPKLDALAGIWKDNPKTQEEIRKLAWGDRI